MISQMESSTFLLLAVITGVLALAARRMAATPLSRRFLRNFPLSILRQFWEWNAAISGGLLLGFLVTQYFFQAYTVISDSMSPTLKIGDVFLAKKWARRIRVPFSRRKLFSRHAVERGFIGVFDRIPFNAHKCVQQGAFGVRFVKRIAALPGDIVVIRRGCLIINGEPDINSPHSSHCGKDSSLSAPPIDPQPNYQTAWTSGCLSQLLNKFPIEDFGPVIVPPNNYFIFSDNRKRLDSRFMGAIPSDLLAGQAWLIVWPPSRWGIIR